MNESPMDLIGLKNWKINSVLEKNNQLSVSAHFTDEVSACNFCQSGRILLRKSGTRKKSVKDAPIRGKHVSISLSIQRYECKKCLKLFTPLVDEIVTNMKITNRLSKYIQDQLFHKTFSQICRETGVCISTVREILVELSNNLQKNYVPQISDAIGIDEVYVGRQARGIITDIRERRLIELLPKRNCDKIQEFLIQINNKEKIKYVTIDMHRPYKIAVNKILPWAKVVIDKFHIQRMGNQAINKYLAYLRDSLTQPEKKMFLRDRFLLYKRIYKLSPEHRNQLKEWIQIFPEIGTIYTLKEKFLAIWQSRHKRSARKKFVKWKNKIPASLMFAFKDILRAFSNWSEEIFNYFECRLTNAFTESLNYVIKSMVRNSKSAAFDTIRAILICKTLLTKPKVKKKLIFDEPFSSWLIPKKSQRVKRLRYIRLINSEAFRIKAPSEQWVDRFAPYLPSLHKD